MLIKGPGAGSPIGTHALVVGVSHYPYADGPQATAIGEGSKITNLTSAAKSASDIADWLLHEYHNPEAQIANVRILLSPVAGEEINPNVAARMVGDPEPATRDAVKREFSNFRKDCKQNSENVAFVYVAGHGVQLDKNGAIVLLHDFAVEREGEDDYLYGAIDITGCHAAMNEAGNAQHQLWFSDACRETPEIAKKFATMSGAFKPGDVPRGEVDASPLYLAASSEEKAFAKIRGNTIFSKALLWALRGGAMSKPDERLCDQWHVSAFNLMTALKYEVRRLLAGQEEQTVTMTGRVSDMVAQRFKAPKVDILIHLKPEGAQPVPQAELLLGGTELVDTYNSWPLTDEIEPGVYALNVTASPAVQLRYTKLIVAEPPGYSADVLVG